MDFQSVIANRKSGQGNTHLELQMLAIGAADHSIPDYQLSAWLMAECFQPLNEEETAWLTVAMAKTGAQLDLTGLPKPWIDKHSTGGVGDKTTIVLLPLLASCGLTIVKMSGRGLGITGGTVDKLESVPGFRMHLTPEELKTQAAAIGLAISGQTSHLAPADKTLYELRDATATVESIPLIVSSILSKKLAGGAEMVVLDVKCGSGGFMPDFESAKKLALALSETGKRIGMPVYISITEMEQPLGRMVGNLLEVQEAAWVLRGGTNRFTELCVELAAHTLVVAECTDSHEKGLSIAWAALREGRALLKAKQWFAAQGAEVDVFGIKDRLPKAKVQLTVSNPKGKGYVSKVDARSVGAAVVHLGGGREVVTDIIDPTAGVECLKHVGDQVEEDEPIFIVHAPSNHLAEQAAEQLREGFEVSEEPVKPLPLILETL
jgi:pyrimidine-nucleoside phosphorylase